MDFSRVERLGGPSSFEQFLIGRNGFAGQFEPHGRDFLYRKGFKGAPILVSAAERDDFVNAYNKTQKVTVFSCVALTLVSVAAVVTIYPDNQAPPEWTTAAMVGVVMIVVFAMTFWSWNAPARALRGRVTMGQAMTATEVRRLALERTSYNQFALAAGIAVFFLLRVGAKRDPLSGWDKLWLVGAVLLIVAAALQAYRKWRSKRSEAKS
jgi:hypothetical protein